MRKNHFKMVMASLCLMIIMLTAGCNFSFNQEKDIQIGKMEEQIKTLRLNNARLKKEIVTTEVIDTGTDLTFVTITGTFILTNNLIWWVICRRRRDEEIAG